MQQFLFMHKDVQMLSIPSRTVNILQKCHKIKNYNAENKERGNASCKGWAWKIGAILPDNVLCRFCTT